MSDQRALRVNTEVFNGFNQYKIRLAGSIGIIPTTVDIVNALLILGDKHFEEIVILIRDSDK